MPHKFLSIKNFDKYQKTKTKDGNRPWIKLWKVILSDPQFMNLTPHDRFLYIGLLLLADDTQNKIYADHTYLRQRLYITHTHGIHGEYIGHTKLNLSALYRSGLLNTSNLARTLSETEAETEAEERERPSVVTLAPSPKGTVSRRPISEEDKPTEKHFHFAQSLGIDPGPEWGKFKNYCLAHGKRYANFEAAFRNWLANAASFKTERANVVR